jgi:hypothetical protein
MPKSSIVMSKDPRLRSRLEWRKQIEIHGHFHVAQKIKVPHALTEAGI